jgi:hypothetical protein
MFEKHFDHKPHNDLGLDMNFIAGKVLHWFYYGIWASSFRHCVNSINNAQILPDVDAALALPLLHSKWLPLKTSLPRDKHILR